MNAEIKETLFDKFCSLKEDAIEIIEHAILKGKKSNFCDFDNGINTLDGVVDKIECDSAGCYLLIDKKCKQLRGLKNEVIIQIACYLEGSWDGK